MGTNINMLSTKCRTIDSIFGQHAQQILLQIRSHWRLSRWIMNMINLTFSTLQCQGASKDCENSNLSKSLAGSISAKTSGDSNLRVISWHKVTNTLNDHTPELNRFQLFIHLVVFWFDKHLGFWSERSKIIGRSCPWYTKGRVSKALGGLPQYF